MGHLGIVVLTGVVLALVAGWLWRRGRAAQKQAIHQLAQLQFVEERPTLGATFLLAAAKTGKPRGLSWEKCELGDSQVFAVDRATGGLFALVGATISFAAIPGGGMEDVEAVGNLRYATAVFVYRGGNWSSDGQAVFNLEPPQALQRYADSLSPWPESLPPDRSTASDR
jgi:hypothetical protein